MKFLYVHLMEHINTYDTGIASRSEVSLLSIYRRSVRVTQGLGRVDMAGFYGGDPQNEYIYIYIVISLKWMLKWGIPILGILHMFWAFW